MADRIGSAGRHRLGIDPGHALRDPRVDAAEPQARHLYGPVQCVHRGAAAHRRHGDGHGAEGLFELLDLGISKCRLMVAAQTDQDLAKGTLKIATKYVNSTKRYFQLQGRQVEVIKLSGAMELAPIVGLAHCIVDLVDTGNTLKANNLVPIELIENISSRLIVNSASFNTKHREITDWVDRIKDSL